MNSGNPARKPADWDTFLGIGIPPADGVFFEVWKYPPLMGYFLGYGNTPRCWGIFWGMEIPSADGILFGYGN